MKEVVKKRKLLAWHLPNSMQFPYSSTQNLFLYQTLLCSQAVIILSFDVVYLNINQLDALNFIMSLFHASLNLCTGRPPIGVMIPEVV